MQSRIAFLFWISFISAAYGQTLVPNPASLTLSVETGHLSQAQYVTVTSSGAALSQITISATTDSGGTWLYYSPPSATGTPVTVAVLAAAYHLSPGVYTGHIVVTAAGPPSATVSIPVTFTVASSSSSSFSVDQTSLSFSGQAGGSSPSSQQVNVSSNPSGMTFSVAASTTNGGNWLRASPASGTAPAAITVSADTSGLAAGTYSGTVTLTPSSGTAITVNVSLTVTASSALNTSVTSLQFSYVVGASTPAAQTFDVTTTGATPLNFSVSVTMTDGTGWLAATPGSGTTPQTITVSVSPASLSAGVYHGKITVSAGGSNGSVDVPVVLAVNNSGTTGLQVDSTSLSFAGQVGGSAPASRQINVTSNPSGMSFSVSAATASGGNWLVVSPLSGTAPAAVTVSANTSGLSTGSYTGTITLTPATGSAVTVTVLLTLTTGPALAASVTSLQFYYTIGAQMPAVQNISITGGAGLAYNVAVVTPGMSGWLAATPISGTIPQTVAVSVSPAGYLSGVYTGTITVTVPSVNSSIDIPVTLTISTGPLLIAGAASSTFVHQSGGSPPQPQTVAITSSAYVLAFTVSAVTSDGGHWLAVSPTATATTPQNVVISITPGSLSPGTYTGAVTISAPNATNSPLAIPVTLTVTNSALVASPLSVTFNYQIGGSNQVLSQPVTLGSSGGDSIVGTIMVAIANCPAGWLTVSPNAFVSPATITLTLNPAGLSQPQSCAGIVILNTNGPTTMISVGVNVTTTPQVNVTPLALTFYAPAQSQPVSQTIKVSSTNNTPVPFGASATTSGGGGWLSFTRTDSATNSDLAVIVNPAAMAVGTYSGTITISSPGAAQIWLVPITLVVTPATIASVNPASVSFTQTVGGTPPPPQTVTLSTIGGSFPFNTSVSYDVSSPPVLNMTPAAGATPATVSIGILPNTLAAGTYAGAVTAAVPAADTKPLTIPVTLNVVKVPNDATIAANPLTLAFSFQQGGVVPPAQQISLTSSGGSFNVAASVTSNVKWLAVAPGTITTPGPFSVSVDPAGLTPAKYNATITLASAGIPGSPISIPVQLEVTAAPVTLPQISAISAIANAASGVRGPIAPGEIVTIAGTLLGPAAGANFTLTSTGAVDTTLAGTKVMVDEFAAPLLYVSAGQVNAIIPYEIAGRSVVQVVVSVQGTQTEPYMMQAGSAAPGIFSSTQTGHGQGAILNADNTLNGPLPTAAAGTPAGPAVRGSIVQVFGTGDGVLTPPATTGSITRESHVTAGTVTATVGGIPAEVVFAGAAPQAIAGLFQVNVRIPQNTLTGDVPLVITINGVSSQAGLTVAVSWW
jgi:trimeric autotransporter adhesin